MRGVSGELEDENWRLSSTTLVRGEAENWRLCSTTLVGGAICGAENWRLCNTTLVRGVSGELEDENWRLCRYNFSARSNLGSWKLRTGDFVVQL